MSPFYHTKDIKQLLSDTQAIMGHFGIEREQITKRLDNHSRRIALAEERLDDIEQALIDRSVLKRGHMVVPVSEIRELVTTEDLTQAEFYKLLISNGIIEPGAHRSTMVMRIEGQPVRVVMLRRED